MHRLKLRVAVAALTFVVGSSADAYVRRPSESTECFGCSSTRCVLVFVADHPLSALENPGEIYDVLMRALSRD